MRVVRLEGLTMLECAAARCVVDYSELDDRLPAIERSTREFSVVLTCGEHLRLGSDIL